MFTIDDLNDVITCKSDFLRCMFVVAWECCLAEVEKKFSKRRKTTCYSMIFLWSYTWSLQIKSLVWNILLQLIMTNIKTILKEKQSIFHSSLKHSFQRDFLMKMHVTFVDVTKTSLTLSKSVERSITFVMN